MTMFERLQSLPLLMGLSVNELVKIVERVKFDFRKHAEGSVLASQGDRCNQLYFLLGGTLCVDYRDSVRNMLISEYIDEISFAIELHNLWGVRQYYDRTYVFTTEGNTCSIDKRQMGQLVSEFDIVKTNVLSTICNRLQSTTSRMRRTIPTTVEERMLQYLGSFFLTRSGKKIVRLKMEDLADAIDTPRLNVSRVLNEWEERQLAELRRGSFIIPAAEKLYLDKNL